MGASAGIMMASSSAAGGISNIGTAYSQSSALRAQGNYQNTVAQANAGMAQTQSQIAVSNGQFQEGQNDLKVRQAVGSERASAAAGGADVSSGSAAQVQASTASIGALDSLTIKNNAWKAAWGYRVQATNESYAGKFAQMGADNAAGNTLLTGGLNAVSAGLKGGYYYYGGRGNPSGVPPASTPNDGNGYYNLGVNVSME